MTTSRTFVIAVLVVFTGVPSSLAQGNGSDSAERFAIATARKDVNGTTPIASSDSQVTLEAREDGSILSALFGVAFGADDRASLALQLSGELQKGEEERELANLHNLPGGVSATLKLSYAPANASRWARRHLVPRPLIEVCKQVNDELRARGPSYDAAVFSPLDGLELKKGKARYDAQRAFVANYFEAREKRVAHLSAASELSRLERAELEALEESQGNSVDILEEQTAAVLCNKWNKGRVNQLLFEEPLGISGKIESPQAAAPCTLAAVAAQRAKSAAIVSCSKLPATVEAPKDSFNSAVSTATAQFKAVQSAADSTADDVSAARARFAERIALATVDLEKGLRDAISLEENQGDLTGSALEAAVTTALKECSDLVSAPSGKAATVTEASNDTTGADGEAIGDSPTHGPGAPLTGGRVASVAEAKETRAAFEEAAAELAKATEGWSVATTPYIFRGPSEVGSLACSPEDVLARLTLFQKRLQNSLYRDLVAAVPSMVFWTVEASTSSQDFKFLDVPLQLNPDSQQIKTTKESHYSYGGRASLSLFVRGWLWTAGYTLEEIWKASPTSQYCFPIGDMGGLTCASVAPKGPSEAQADTYDLQLKRNFSPSFALAAKLFYKEQNSVTNPHVLLYFLPQGGRLRGGFDFSYVEGSATPEGDGFAARLFVGLPFSL